MSKPGPVLVLGGQGYIGGAIARHFGTSGYSYSLIDFISNPIQPALSGRMRYQNVSAEVLAKYETVVLLAGHSTIAACVAEPVKSFENNVSGFVELIHKLRGQKFIFASSVGIYVDTAGRSANEDNPLPEPGEIYDLHKQEIERYAKFRYPNSYALRFGTVCGPSPNMRPTILNGMVQSAIRDGRVVASNANKHRAILGLGDLCRAVETIITGSVAPGVYNLASGNLRIGEAAEWIGKKFNVPVVQGDGSALYDIRVSTVKFCVEANFEFRDTAESLTDELAEHFKK